MKALICNQPEEFQYISKDYYPKTSGSYLHQDQKDRHTVEFREAASRFKQLIDDGPDVIKAIIDL